MLPEFIGRRFETIDRFPNVVLMLWTPAMNDREFDALAAAPIKILIPVHLGTHPQRLEALRKQLPKVSIQAEWPWMGSPRHR